MINVWRIKEAAKLPERMTDGSVGYDICSAADYLLRVGDFVIIKTGLVVKPPDGYHFEIALRSSIPKKKGLLIPNGIGIIDQDYCGEGDELGIPVFKFRAGTEDEANLACIEEGERIAQLLLRKSHVPEVFDCSSYPFLDKGRGGFGSTGGK